MNPISRSIDAIEERIGYSPHPAIVAVPVGAFVTSNVSDGLYLLTGNEAYDGAAHVSMAVGLIGAAGALATGLRDYGNIPQSRQPSHNIATRHGLGNAVVGSLFLTSFIMRTRDRAAGYRTGLVPRLLALGGGALAVYTAWLGGKLVQEYGEAVKPLIAAQASKPSQLEAESLSGSETEEWAGQARDLHEEQESREGWEL